MSLFRKRKPKQSEEQPSTEPDSSSPFASFDAAWRAEDEVESQRQSERLKEPVLTLAPLGRIFTLRRVLTLLGIIVVVALVWAVALGPIRPVLGTLKDLPQRILALIPTPEPATLTPIPPTPTSTSTRITLPPTFTPAASLTPSPETSPTSALEVVPEITATPEPSITPTTEVAGCTPSESVTLADVGKTMCVTGNVIQTIERTTSFSILVGTRKDSFFFVSYEKTYNLKKGTCIYATGEVVQLGSNPIMLLGYATPLELCNP